MVRCWFCWCSTWSCSASRRSSFGIRSKRRRGRSGAAAAGWWCLHATGNTRTDSPCTWSFSCWWGCLGSWRSFHGPSADLTASGTSRTPSIACEACLFFGSAFGATRTCARCSSTRSPASGASHQRKLSIWAKIFFKGAFRGALTIQHCRKFKYTFLHGCPTLVK